MSLAQELNQKMSEVISTSEANLDKDTQWFKSNVAGPIESWFKEKFPKLFGSRTPRGGKQVKQEAERILWSLKNRVPMSGDRETGLASLRSEVDRFRPHVDDFVKLFSNQTGATVPLQVEVNGNTYKNLRGFSEKTLMKHVRTLDGILNSLKGWKRKALKGGVTIALAGPDQFRGTAGGVYRSGEDVMYVRATPSVLKRTGNSYGSFEYIFVHEMGHRYEYKVGVTIDFDRQEWRTTRYSSKDGESFAELFALSHFGIRELRGNDFNETLGRFENAMMGKRLADRYMLLHDIIESASAARVADRLDDSH